MSVEIQISDLNTMVRIGFTISKNHQGKTLSQAIELYIKSGMTAFQICMTPSHNGYEGKKLDISENQKIRKLCKENNIYSVVHGKYIYNFCRQDNHYQIDLLVHELELANEIGCDVILHQGKNVAEEKLTRLQALDNYVKHITEALEKTFDLNNGILLENSSKQGSELGYSLDELAYIYNHFNDSVRHRIGFCLDLCHIFVAGELDLRKAEDVELFFCQFESLIGLDKLKCIHFNDSSIPFNGCNDHHGDINCGYISNPLLGGSIEGFKIVAKIAKMNGAAIIFETPCKFNHLHQIYSQGTWQRKIVTGWAEENDAPYLKYLKTNPHINILAHKYYTENKKKNKKNKKNKNLETSTTNVLIVPIKINECNCHSHEEKIPLQLKSQPKLKLKLKSEIINATQ